MDLIVWIVRGVMTGFMAWVMPDASWQRRRVTLTALGCVMLFLALCDPAEAAKGARSTVVESLGTVWLFTIEGAGWRPSGGERIAEIGPLPVSAEVPYVSEYMEAIFTPGMTAPVHRHAGPEAWYTMAGETCLETPEGKLVGRAGGEGFNFEFSYG